MMKLSCSNMFPLRIKKHISRQREFAMQLGATYLGEGQCHFLVWAPFAKSVEVRIFDDSGLPDGSVAISGKSATEYRLARLAPGARGYHEGELEGVKPGSLYVYRLDGNKERPDPASRFQPSGVHGPSQVEPSDYRWNDASWSGIPLEDYIIYEIHVGTYTPEGTFSAIIPYLDEIRELGITALELMPLAQFPGSRNWGYDGVHPFSVQNSYGGPGDLRSLVDACHQRGMAAVLDVVYNHLGPEGNYLGDFGPYFTDQYQSPWGRAINFDGPHSDEVVRFFIENALYWIQEFHIDALRLDAIHGIVDRSAQPFLRLLAQSVHEFARKAGRKIYLIAESDLNDVRFILPAESAGYGLDAQWSDDFHHALHALLTKERMGYYEDFGRLGDLAKAFEEGYVYTGQYSRYRNRRHGNASRDLPARQFTVFAQNHDQVGNRAFGERLTALLSFEALKLAAGMVHLSPFIPLLFMGEEYGEGAPFQYFTSHLDPGLIEAVRQGRREEFAAFKWKDEPPDPQAESTFAKSKLDHSLSRREPHQTLQQFYRALISLRRELPGFRLLSKKHLEARAFEREQVLQIRRWSEAGEALIAANFGEEPVTVRLPIPRGAWRKVLDSAEQRWKGEGSAVPESLNSQGQAAMRLSRKSFSVFERL
jgi:maltooligosyltrehalose trehalohydrolase